jgi:hypothetical protein
MLLFATESFFRHICDGTAKHHGRPITLVDSSGEGHLEERESFEGYCQMKSGKCQDQPKHGVS